MTGGAVFLGIESSCDDTAAALVRRGGDGSCEILSNQVRGQDELHAGFGGVVPEIAARAHAERLDGLVAAALTEAGLGLEDLGAVAVTAGPGLIGGLIAGTSFARGLAAARGLPLYPVNHLAGHALSPRLGGNVPFPYLMLLVSGGHCQFLRVESALEFRRLGGTIDDAPGEVLDKIARLIGTALPGGRGIEALAEAGDPERFHFPRPLVGSPGANMSFSGLKTAVRRAAEGLTDRDRADIAAGLQAAVADILAAKARAAIGLAGLAPGAVFAAAGGVAANRRVRSELAAAAERAGLTFAVPPPDLCTDNGAMIAWAAIEAEAAGATPETDFPARPRWPLDAEAAPMLGSGRKGAKA